MFRRSPANICVIFFSDSVEIVYVYWTVKTAIQLYMLHPPCLWFFPFLLLIKPNFKPSNQLHKLIWNFFGYVSKVSPRSLQSVCLLPCSTDSADQTISCSHLLTWLSFLWKHCSTLIREMNKWNLNKWNKSPTWHTVPSSKKTRFRNFWAPVVCCVQFERLTPFLIFSTREFVPSVQNPSRRGIDLHF